MTFTDFIEKNPDFKSLTVEQALIEFESACNEQKEALDEQVALKKEREFQKMQEVYDTTYSLLSKTFAVNKINFDDVIKLEELNYEINQVTSNLQRGLTYREYDDGDIKIWAAYEDWEELFSYIEKLDGTDSEKAMNYAMLNYFFVNEGVTFIIKFVNTWSEEPNYYKLDRVWTNDESKPYWFDLNEYKKLSNRQDVVVK